MCLCVNHEKKNLKIQKNSTKKKQLFGCVCVCVHGFCHHFFNHRHWSGHWVQNFVFFLSLTIIWLWFFFSIHESNVIIIFLNEWILLDLSSLFIIHKTKNTHTHANKCWNNVSLMRMKTTLLLDEIKSDLKPKKWCWNNGI